uniref:Uncharacterized protein n=1 Tax=viral metagenome TaxID=1070528 RepID=A0A6C0CBW5_9ZZZZ
MYSLDGKVIDQICKFLDCHDMIAFLSCNHGFYMRSLKVIVTEPVRFSQLINSVFCFDRFTNILFGKNTTVCLRYMCHNENIYMLQSHHPQNDKLIDVDEKITVNFIKPTQKTKFVNINKVRHIMFIGKINLYDERIRNAGIFCLPFGRIARIEKQHRFLADAEFKKIAKFYIAHNDLNRFQKLIDAYPISLADHELLLYTQLMRPMPTKILVYILNHETTNSSAVQYRQFLMYANELGIPIEIRQKIILEHTALFLNLY